MNKLKQYALNAGIVIAGVGAALLPFAAHAEVATTSDVSVAFSGVLNSIVLAIVNVIVTFFTNNLPIIVILGTCIGLVWYFVHKAQGSSKGR
jgi:hypothetical protein